MKTNLEVLNEISEKLGGQGNATSVTESLNNIANALGDTNPDEIISVSDSLEDILQYAGQGGGGDIKPKLTITVTNNSNSLFFFGTIKLKDGNIVIADAEEYAAVNPTETITFSTLVLGVSDGENNIYQYNNSYFQLYGSMGTGVIDYANASEQVNCTCASDGFTITDPSQDASITVEVVEQGA